MNQNKIDFQPSRGPNGDSINSKFGNCFLYFDINQSWNGGARSQTAAMAGRAEQLPSAVAAKSSTTTIMSGFASPAYAFYATERCMGFQQYDCQAGNPSSTSSQFSNPNDLEFPLYQSDPAFELSNTLQAMVKSQLTGKQYCTSTSPEKSSKFLPVQQHDVASVKRTSSSNLYKGNQDHTVAIGSYNLDVAHLGFSSSQQEKLSPTTVSGNPVSNGTVVSSKSRIRWTQDLHEKFVECVNRLGGAEKATPKAILKLMGSVGLTIFHVKSHLQKYRIAKYMPESAQGKSDKRTHVEDVHHLDAKAGQQIREALQLQLDVQRRLHEQLEIQRKLQLRIEEQGRKLKMMFDQQQKTSSTTNDDTPNGPKDVEPSISEGSGEFFLPFQDKLAIHG